MNKAKSIASEFLGKSGHNTTDVTEEVAPAVVNEHVLKTKEEQVQELHDKEIHQDHFHRTVQPVKDREVLPEQHSHNVVGVEHREHRHGDASTIKAKLEQEAAQFKNTRTEDVRETSSVAPVVAGEHVHHHVHEVIQPVVQKETIQPSVVHTTIPVHEVHHNEPKHHAASALPAVSMADFKKQGGVLGGRDERHDHFDGEPKGVTSSLGGLSSNGSGINGGRSGLTGDNVNRSGYTEDSRGSNITGSHHQTTAGPHGNLGNKLDPRVDSDVDGSRTAGRNTGRTGYDNISSTQTKTKPSLSDRLNPMKDTDGDGKKGMMD